MEEISGDSTAHQLAVLQRSAPAAAKYVHAVEDYAVHSYFKRCVVPLRCSLPRALISSSRVFCGAHTESGIS